MNTSEGNCIHDKQQLFVKNGFPIVECRKCLRRFTEISDPEAHLENVYSDDYFFNGKDGYPNYFYEKELLINSGIRYSNIIKRYTKPGKMLDVGCAAGFILKGFERTGWCCSGIEPNKTMASYGKDQLKLDISVDSMETYNSDSRFDLITLIQVIGHFYNVDKAISNVSHLSADKGLVLVESWNMQSLVARLLGRHWREYSPPSVINWFSDKSLIKLFNNNGFQFIGSGLPAKRIILKHLLSLLDINLPGVPDKKIIDTFWQKIGTVVLIYPPVDLKWYLFRKC